MRKAIAVLCLLMVLAIFVAIFHEPLNSFLWHWRHDDSIDLEGYRIRVPKLWYVEYVNGPSISLVRAHPSAFKSSFLSRGTVSILRKAASDLAFWELQERSSFERLGVATVEKRDFRVAPNVRVICLQGRLVRDPNKGTDSALLSVVCQSEGPVNVTFTGTQNDLHEFYDVVGNISR